ncbi:MAG: hypothetical protein WCR69_09410, partial [Sulfuricurvum sp.]
TSTLTGALDNLANTKADLASFLEGLALDTDIDGTVDVEAGKATDTNVTTYFNNAATNIAGEASTTLNATDYQDLEKQALQNVDIQTALTKAEGDVSVATTAAKTGMTALIEAANEAKTEYNAAQEAKIAKTTAETMAAAAFDANTANASVKVGDSKVIFAADYDATANNSSKIIISGGKAYTGENASGKAISELVEDTTVQYVTELETAHLATVAATANEANALAALKAAVGDVYVLELGGHSLASIGADGAAVTAASGAINLADTTVKVYKTADDAAKNVVQQVITFKAETGSDTINIRIDGVDIAIAANDANTAVATKVLAETFTNWTVAAGVNNGEVVFTAKSVSTNELEAGDIVITGDGTMAAPTIDAATEVNIGATDTLAAASSKADDLKTAIEALAALEKAVADFQDARDLKVELESLNKAIVDANKAITDSVEDGGLGVTLREKAQNFTTADDVYLFDAKDSANQSLTNFGAKGNDTIFFGSSFTGGLKEITKVANDNGDAGKLEIFWLQNGADVEIYVEQKAFAGNGSTDADLVKVTLSGVTGADLSLNDDGFLTIA